eukprot:gene598-1942_t
MTAAAAAQVAAGPIPPVPSGQLGGYGMASAAVGWQQTIPAPNPAVPFVADTAAYPYPNPAAKPPRAGIAEPVGDFICGRRCDDCGEQQPLLRSSKSDDTG